MFRRSYFMPALIKYRCVINDIVRCALSEYFLPFFEGYLPKNNCFLFAREVSNVIYCTCSS